MPLYEFRERGGVVLRVLPVARRDDFPNRISVPSRLSVCPRGEPTQEDGLLKGWREIEEQDGSGARRLEKSLGLTADKVKDAMLAPCRTLPGRIET
jgi:hypothetical protein